MCLPKQDKNPNKHHRVNPTTAKETGRGNLRILGQLVEGLVAPEHRVALHAGGRREDVDVDAVHVAVVLLVHQLTATAEELLKI